MSDAREAWSRIDEDEPVADDPVRAASPRPAPGIDPALLAITVLAILLRLPHLVDRSIWYDEASSWQTASFTFPELMRSVRLNVHMPLYYVLLKGWFQAFGDSPVALRGFSVTFGVLTVVLTDRFARSVYRASGLASGEQAARARMFGLASALLVAVSPYMVQASIEARMYSLASALATLGAWQLVELARGRNERCRWWAFGTTCIALAYSHHYGLLSVASFFGLLYGVAMWRLGSGDDANGRRLLARAALTAIVVGVLYLPGLQILQGQVARVQQDYWIRPLSLETFVHTFAEFVFPLPADLSARPMGWIPAGLFVAACLVACRGAKVGEAAALASALGPLLLAAALCVWTPVWVARFFRISHPALLVVVVLAVFRLARTWPAARVAVITALGGALLACNLPFWSALDLSHNLGPRGVAERIAAESAASEWVVVLDIHHYFPLKYYLRNEPVKVRLLKPAFELFWGPHLVRDADLITPSDVALGARGAGGIWIVGNTAVPIGLELPAGDVVVDRFETTSALFLHRRIFASHHVYLPD